MSGSTRAWSIYSGSGLDPRSSSENSISSPPMYEVEGGWKELGSTSMSAISFGFLATAILISLFLIMAILEHLLKPNHLSISSSTTTTTTTNHGPNLESGSTSKIINQDMVMKKYGTAGLSSVVMPGQKYPTCIAQPAPLLPMSRETIYWPPHHNNDNPKLLLN